jgi:O-antigen/teichoic acid export membrane protein
MTQVSHELFNMNATKRIIVNTAATYGQSVFAIVVTLFSARWILMALGDSDFGLFGVVGSLTLLITFLSGGLSVGVARFYAYSIGEMAHEAGKVPADDLKRWFNTAFSIHAVVPFLFVMVGWPVGTYAIQHWLTIPTDRIDACLIVFRMSLFSTFVTVFAVPFVSMYQAHQYIFELAAFGVLRMIAVLAVAWSLLHVDSDKLIVYAGGMMAISVMIQSLQILRACIKFDACRVHFAYMYNAAYMKKLFSYVGWKMFGMSCVALRTQGAPVLVNIFYGPLANAAYSIATRVSVQATTLSTAMTSAFQPALVSAEGQGDRERVILMSIQVSKFGALMVLIFTIPLVLEMQTLLDLWLVQPPQYAVQLCQWMSVMLVVDRISSGAMLAVNAYGKIALYEVVQGALFLVALLFIWLFHLMGLGLPSVGGGLFISMTLYCTGRLIFAKHLLAYPVVLWFKQVLLPITFLVIVSTSVGCLVVAEFDANLFRLVMTSGVTGIATSLIGWFFLLNRAERAYALGSVRKVVLKLI